MFRYDLHTHTMETSRCSNTAGADLVKAYHALGGFTGLVVTNHYNPEEAKRLRGEGWDTACDFFFAGYRAALAPGREMGLIILPGMEFRFPSNNNDYLVYGVDEESFSRHPEIADIASLREFRPLAQAEGWLVFQAHPFRNGMTVVPPALLDGIEGVNGNPRHQSRNEIAQAWAKLHSLPIVGGADFHRLDDEGTVSVVFESHVQNAEGLVQALRSGQHRVECITENGQWAALI